MLKPQTCLRPNVKSPLSPFSLSPDFTIKLLLLLFYFLLKNGLTIVDFCVTTFFFLVSGFKPICSNNPPLQTDCFKPCWLAVSVTDSPLVAFCFMQPH